MKIKYFLALLTLGFALNASATNTHKDKDWGNVWSIPVKQGNAHDIVIGNGFSLDLDKFFGDKKKDDVFSWLNPKGGFDLGWLLGGLKDLFGHIDLGHHDWHWGGKDPWCPPGTVSPVPEPETYAMLLAGLGLLGAVARRKQKKMSQSTY